ncbi:MAG: acyl-CoA desaturase [Streptosporangiales bacterium]|nr:acyl-CoA desaturase [Streptosporangiales bacterium]
MTPPPTALAESEVPKTRTTRPDLDPDPTGNGERALVLTFVIVPLLALAAAVPVAWAQGGIGLSDIVIGAVFYVVSGLGVTVGFHRYFTHGAFKAKRGLRIALAIAGSLSIEGSVAKWVADHRRHHKYSDQEGDPHSPWRFGKGLKPLLKGLAWAHIGWMLTDEKTNVQRFAPDLVADKDIRRVDKAFPVLVAITLLLPAVIGGLWTMSLGGAISAFFWASLVRVCLLHHVTWSINSICHVFGEEEFEARDMSRNVWWLAIPSFGESWHNLHHADPTCARHGVLKGQIDSSARTIWVLEKFGWAYDVRWPKAERLAAKRIA